jgi:hypothetical protein
MVNQYLTPEDISKIEEFRKEWAAELTSSAIAVVKAAKKREALAQQLANCAGLELDGCLNAYAFMVCRTTLGTAEALMTRLVRKIQAAAAAGNYAPGSVTATDLALGMVITYASGKLDIKPEKIEEQKAMTLVEPETDIEEIEEVAPTPVEVPAFQLPKNLVLNLAKSTTGATSKKPVMTYVQLPPRPAA